MAKTERPTRLKGKAPSGDAVMPDLLLAAALGYFVIAWSLVESTIEMCIAKQLRLWPLDGSIITASGMFQGRAKILLSLLNRAPQRNAEAIQIVKSLRNIEERNDMMHSVIGSGKNTIWFNRRRTEEKFLSKIEVYDAQRLLDLAERCSGLATALMGAHGMTKEDYKSFFETAHNAVNSDSTSPVPPLS